MRDESAYSAQCGQADSCLLVRDLCKTYPGFTLDHVSFSLARGKITGFIGRNGAGKTTTLKSILNLVHPSGGMIEYFGLPLSEQELAIKQRIGCVFGGIDYYMKKKIGTITDVTRRFYEQWDEKAYETYLQRFALDPEKTPSDLSAGMKVKYNLALALSHKAELLILDEPTSGLDPVSREELLDIFLGLADEGRTIFFSTHITADLDKCADNILYIQKGKIIDESTLDAFISRYRLLEVKGEVPPELMNVSLGVNRVRDGHTVLLSCDDARSYPVRPANLDEIMVHLEKEPANENTAQ